MSLATATFDLCDVPVITNREHVCVGTVEYVGAMAACDQAIQVDPEDADAYLSLAWLLATHPDEHLRDGKRAVQLAQRALALSPRSPSLTETLAAAHAEARNFEEAVFWRTESLSAAPAPRS